MHRLLHTPLLIAMTAACFTLATTDSAQAQQKVETISIDRFYTYEVEQYIYLPEVGVFELGVAYRSSIPRRSEAVASFLNAAISDFGMGYGDAYTRTLIEDVLGLRRGALSENAMYVEVHRVSPFRYSFATQDKQK